MKQILSAQTILWCGLMAREMSGAPQVRYAEGSTAPQWGEAESEYGNAPKHKAALLLDTESGSLA
ncbi:MAG: hypothetical protein E3J21_09040 [Anaerolineales bacterium]|nr:MAG: hypothetical protein E3J21_09040 [Anaerolineales bacterium]